MISFLKLCLAQLYKELVLPMAARTRRNLSAIRKLRGGYKGL
jgi:hypothetical protein